MLQRMRTFRQRLRARRGSALMLTMELPED